MVRIARDSLIFVVGFSLSALSLDAAEQPAVAENPGRPGLSEKQIDELVADLAAPEFTRRQKATKQLATGGGRVVDAVSEAARTGNLEVATRAVQILEFIFIYGIPESSMKAQVALEDLADLQQPLASGSTIQTEVNTVLALNYRLRESRALIAIRRLGGIIRYRESLDGTIQDVTDDQPPEILILTLQEWKGTSKDLKYIKRLDRLQQLYVVRKEVGDMEYVRAISENDVAEIEAALPGVEVSWRGPAFLGVSGIALGGQGCRLDRVTPGGAADKAGLKPNDLLLQFDGQDVNGFEQLVRLIGRHDPGDKIPATALRGNQLMEFEITLTGWK